MTHNGYAIYAASTKLQADKEAVRAAITQNGDSLRYASTEFKANKEVVIAAVAQCENALEHAAAPLRSGDCSDGLRACMLDLLRARRAARMVLFASRPRVSVAPKSHRLAPLKPISTPWRAVPYSSSTTTDRTLLSFSNGALPASSASPKDLPGASPTSRAFSTGHYGEP